MKRFISALLAILLVFSLTAAAFAEEVGEQEERPLLVSLGDSVATGALDDRQDGQEEVSFSELVAQHYGMDFCQLARVGLRSIDLLYFLNAEYERQVRSGEVSHTEYNPSVYTDSPETVAAFREKVSEADLITLFIGANDIINYPSQYIVDQEETYGTVGDYFTEMRELIGNGKLDGFWTLRTLKALGVVCRETAAYLYTFTKMINGYLHYLYNYERIVSKIRELNPEAQIVLIGFYIPAKNSPIFQGSDDPSPLQESFWRMIDKINLNVKDAAVKYDCIYVQSQGVESNFHPTPAGYEELANDIISAIDSGKQLPDADFALGIFEKAKYSLLESIESAIGNMTKLFAI